MAYKIINCFECGVGHRCKAETKSIETLLSDIIDIQVKIDRLMFLLKPPFISIIKNEDNQPTVD